MWEKEECIYGEKSKRKCLRNSGPEYVNVSQKKAIFFVIVLLQCCPVLSVLSSVAYQMSSFCCLLANILHIFFILADTS